MKDRRFIAPLILGLTLVAIGTTTVRGTLKMLVLAGAIVLLAVSLVMLNRGK